MDSMAGKSVLLRSLRMFLVAGARIVVLGTTLVGTGCVIVPVPSVTPDNESDIIDETTLESLIGLDKVEVIERIGQPDFSGPRERSYMMVYQGETTYSTDIYVGGVGAIGPIIFPYAAKVETSYSEIIHCYVIELDENQVVQGYNVIDNAPRGTRRDSSDEQVVPIADCAEAVWEPDERRELRIAELEAQASQGNREAALLLARKFRDTTYLKQLAEMGDRRAALALAVDFSDSEPLRIIVEKGDRVSAMELARLTGEATETLRTMAENGDRGAAISLARHANEFGPLNSLAEKGDYEAAHILAAEYDDYSYLRSLSKEGDYVVAYEKYLSFRNPGKPSEFFAAWNWLCLAANAGYSKAQAEVGSWHRSIDRDDSSYLNDNRLELLRKVGVRPDNRIAYMWYTLATSNGDESTLYARDYYLAELLTDSEVAQAEQMVRDWTPGDCPSPENRLRPPGES